MNAITVTDALPTQKPGRRLVMIDARLSKSEHDFRRQVAEQIGLPQNMCSNIEALRDTLENYSDYHERADVEVVITSAEHLMSRDLKRFKKTTMYIDVFSTVAKVWGATVGLDGTPQVPSHLALTLVIQDVPLIHRPYVSKLVRYLAR